MEISEFEFHRCKVDSAYRINLPVSIVRAVGWITAEGPIKSWLVLLSADRARLLSPTVADSDAQIQTMAARINSGLNITGSDPLERGDESEIGLAFRLFPLEIKPPQPLRRLAFPMPVVTAMQLHGGTSELAALIFRGDIEFWTIDLVRASVSKPIPELV